MPIAILSDIHSNLEALQEAMIYIEHAGVDEVVCLGDIVGYGPDPNECVDIIKSACSRVVKGNHDAAACGQLSLGCLNRPGRAAMEWTQETLTRENREYLASLPLIEKNGGTTFVHASPLKPEEWTYIDSPYEAAPAFEAFDTPVCTIGHTHVPGILSEDLATLVLKEGLRCLINVGSVGQPRDGNPRLSFGLLDVAKWKYENIRIDYKIGDVAKRIVERRLPGILAERLYDGR
ncbi:MAG: hypothetical protein COS95_05285 [Ignavibacteriales bacterium CG07_land_8_20_14_0_80_59_12]|nr:MAG: hypothetical protein COS95_05285 [Ignavibacteriales bacterium CG07_land_8_20_14_0_80_59_12]